MKDGYCQPLPRPEDCPEVIYKLLTRCQSTDPQNRPTFTQVVEELEAYVNETHEQQQDLGSRLASPGCS